MTDGSEPDPPPQDATLRLIYDHLVGVLREQAAAGQQLDTKMLGVLSVGGLVLGVSSPRTIGHSSPAQGFLLLAAVAAFFVLAVFCLRQLSPTQYRVSDDAPNVWNALWAQSPEVVMHALIHDIVEGYEANGSVLSKKAERLRAGIIALTAEVILVGLAVVVGRA